jgi:two-component system chemotaxis sensor kinase CheA
MEDITAEKELKQQLLAAENLRENEMRSLFQVIQLDPMVLRDFIADAEPEFEKINGTLKDKNSLQQNVLVRMYQSIHAIKSNALILSLENLSERLHRLESSIKKIQGEYKEAVPFDGFLGLVLELNDAMKEIDKLKGNVSKIENFRMMSKREDKNQETYVLVETLSRACSKTQTALGKKVRFVAEDIDEGILEHAPRRVIKEVLTQLVRNAVYHGIETPYERTARGKDPQGEIRLSLKYQDNQIVINLSDNGKGIDFNKIRKIALESNLLRNPEQANDTRYLLKVLFSPGFSTLDKADHHAGRGIGLNLVKDRVKEMNGKISVASEPGKGTAFTIFIPLVLPAAQNVS